MTVLQAPMNPMLGQSMEAASISGHENENASRKKVILRDRIGVIRLDLSRCSKDGSHKPHDT